MCHTYSERDSRTKATAKHRHRWIPKPAPPFEGVKRTGLRAPAKVQKTEDECNSLADLHRLCTRLSRSKIDAIIKYVTKLKHQNDDMVNMITKYEQDLKAQAEINARLFKRTDNLEAGPFAAVRLTMARVVAKTAKKSKVSSIQELTKIIPTIKARQPANAVKIVPPVGTKNPEIAIEKVYNPAQYNIRVRRLRSTASNDLIVRTEGPDDAQKLIQSETLTKNGYKVIPIKARDPKILIFGTDFKTKSDPINQIFEQNEEIAGQDPRKF